MIAIRTASPEEYVPLSVVVVKARSDFAQSGASVGTVVVEVGDDVADERIIGAVVDRDGAPVVVDDAPPVVVGDADELVVADSTGRVAGIETRVLPDVWQPASATTSTTTQSRAILTATMIPRADIESKGTLRSPASFPIRR